jgi:hypothetical protein
LEIGIREVFSNLWQQTQLGKDPIGPFLPVPLFEKGGPGEISYDRLKIPLNPSFSKGDFQRHSSS